jgi:pyruvate kinase
MTSLRVLRDELVALERDVVAAGAAHEPLLANVDPRYRDSARNFVEYVGLRQHDLRPLQRELWAHGLSSLGRLEGHVRDAIGQVRARLDDAVVRGDAPAAGAALTWEEAQARLHANTQALLGPRPSHRHVYVMVTAPTAAEVDAAWVERLLAAGMDVLRINAAHEDEAAWLRIATTARAVGGGARRGAAHRGRSAWAQAAHGDADRRAAGGEVEALPRRAGPRGGAAHDRAGTPRPIGAIVDRRRADGADLDRGPRSPPVTRRSTVPRCPRQAPSGAGDLERGDANGRGEVDATTYVTPGAQVCVTRVDRVYAEFTIVDVPARRARLEVAVGQTFAVVAEGTPVPDGMPGIGCTLPAALAGLTLGQRVLFDDGHLETEVVAIEPGQVQVRVTHAPGGRFRLGAEKGINLPDSELALPLCSADDERALAFAGAPRRSGRRVVRARARGRPRCTARPGRLGADRLGVVLKIETTGAFARLPAIMLAALERAPSA